MKFNFRKISAVLASGIMAVSSIGFAAAANYPAPFVSGGVADVAIVYGTGAGVSSLDIIQSGNIQTNLQSYLSGGGSTDSTVSGGDSKVLSSSSRKMYYGDTINAPISSLTYTELGTVLADGTFTDLSGTEYDYTQTVKVGPADVIFGTSGGDISDPALYIDVGTTTTTAQDGVYNYTLSFTKNVNVSDPTNVQGQKLKILDVDYVIGASSTNTTLYLYGSGETITVTGGESATVNIGGTEHTIELVTTSSTTAGTVKVDGTQKTVTEGSNYAFPGEINVYIKDILHPAYAGDIRQAELIIGANTLKLVNGQTVKKGADETAIKGTNAVITAAGNGVISGITVQVAAEKSKVDSIGIGESFSDPVFGGLKLTFSGAVPSLDSESRGQIVVSTNDNDQAYLTLTSARAASAGEQKITYVYDNNTASTAITPLLAHSTSPSTGTGKGIIHVLEGENARESDWIILNQGDAGTILEITDISVNTATSGSVTFEDAITGDSQTITLTNSTGPYTKTGVNMFGGTGYTVNIDGAAGTAVNVTWSSSGTRTLFPRIKLANGGWVAFLTETTYTNATNVILPDGLTTLATSGSLLTYNGAGGEAAKGTEANGINWTFGNVSSSNSTKVSGIANTNSYCNFSSAKGPAVLYIEPKKWDDASYGNHICVPLTTTGTLEIAIGDPVFNGSNSGFVTLNSDTYQKEAVDIYGSHVIKEDRTNQNGVATINYPSSQMYFDVLFAAVGATITPGTTTAGTQLGEVLYKDSETSQYATKNLIIVGGSCINSAAASVLGAGCGEAFTANTGVGSGQFLIKGVSGSSITSKLALVVAGYNVEDTVNAAKYLTTQTVDTSKQYKGTSATTAELVTTETA